MGDRTPVVLGVDEGEGLDEHEDKSVAESGKEREGKDDGFGEEHFKGTDPGDKDLFERESLLEGRDFVRPVEIGVGASLAAFLGNAVHHYGGSGLGDEKKMGELNGAAENQLCKC